jgi:hypothetical protein
MCTRFLHVPGVTFLSSRWYQTSSSTREGRSAVCSAYSGMVTAAATRPSTTPRQSIRNHSTRQLLGCPSHAGSTVQRCSRAVKQEAAAAARRQLRACSTGNRHRSNISVDHRLKAAHNVQITWFTTKACIQSRCCPYNFFTVLAVSY